MKILLDVLPGAEGDAAARSLGLRLPLQRGSALQEAPSEALVVWVHRAPDQAWDLPAPAAGVAALKTRIERGGRLLLTGPAVELLVALGLEPELPAPRPERLAEPGPRGVQPFLDHPLFRRFPGGVLLAETPPGGSTPGFGATTRPRNGVLTGVEKTREGCVPERGLLLEHRLGAGRVLSLLGPLRFAADDAYGEHRLRFAGDLVDYLLSDGRAAAARPWPAGVAQVEVVSGWPLPAAGPASETGAPTPLPRPELTELPSMGGGWRGLASPAGLLWQEWEGRGEVWVRGTRILRELRRRVITGAREVDFSGAETVVARAPGLLWQQVDGAAEAGAACAVVATAGGFSFLGFHSDPKALLEIEGVLEHALEAPWPPSSLAPLRVQRAPDGQGLLWQDGVLGRAALLRFAAAPVESEGSVCEGERESGYRFRVRVPLPADGPAVVTLSAAESLGELARPLPPAAGVDQTLARVSLGDSSRDQELLWSARNALECALPMRSGERVLLGGFGATPPALLGAEALWAVEPLLWYGARDLVRSTLSCLARHLDASGRIPRRVLWSGIPQSDALEPTLLFPSALGAWLEVTGDVELLRSCWPALLRAVRLLEERDRDGDGVPELMDAGSSLLIRVDQIALLVRGLRAASRVADALGERNAALSWNAWSEQLHARLHSACFDAELGAYALGIGGQGVPVRELTPLCAIPVALGLSEPAVAGAALAAFSAPEQALASGVRHGAHGAEARTSHARDTGLLALAEFRAGRPEQGWAWLRCLLQQVRELAPAGIPHAIAATQQARLLGPERDTLGHVLVLGAVLQGMLGIAADAGLSLSPALPAGQEGITFADLRFRGHVLAGEVRRGPDAGDLLVTLRKADEALLPVTLAPFFGRGWEPHQVLAGEEPREFQVVRVGEGCRAVVRAELRRELSLRFCTAPVAEPEAVPAPPPAMRFVGGPVQTVATESLPPEPPAPAPDPAQSPPDEPPHEPPSSPYALDVVRVVSAVPAVYAVSAYGPRGHRDAALVAVADPIAPAALAAAVVPSAMVPAASASLATAEAELAVAVAETAGALPTEAAPAPAVLPAASEPGGLHPELSPVRSDEPLATSGDDQVLTLAPDPEPAVVAPQAELPPAARPATPHTLARRTASARGATGAAAPARRHLHKFQALIAVLVVAMFGGGAVFVFNQDLFLAEAREQGPQIPLSAASAEQSQALSAAAGQPGVPPEHAPLPPSPVQSTHSAVEIAPVPQAIETLDLTTLVQLLGPPCDGQLPEDGRCAFRLHDGGLLVGEVASGAWSAVRVVPALPSR